MKEEEQNTGPVLKMGETHVINMRETMVETDSDMSGEDIVLLENDEVRDSPGFRRILRKYKRLNMFLGVNCETTAKPIDIMLT